MTDENVEQVSPQAELDYDSMSADDLDNLMRKDADEAMFGPPPAQEEVEEVPAEQAAPAESNEPETAAAETPADDAPELDERDLQIQELTLRMESLSAQKELSDLASSKNAGMLGHIQKQMANMAAERQRPAPAEDLYIEDESTAEPYRQPRPGRADDALGAKVAELQAEQLKGATERIYTGFLNQISSDLTAQGVEQANLDNEQKAIMEQITPTLKQRFEPFGDISQMQHKTVEKVVNMVLQSAYTDVKLNKVAEMRKLNLERKASQIAESRIVKQAASPSGSGGKSTKEPPPKRVEDMTADEADAALIALYGDGGYRPRR